MNQDVDLIDVFLCHTGANKDWVRSLATRLEGETIDDRPLRVFFDEWDIAPGENILGRIEEGLQAARFLAVALSPALTRASWPTLEWQTQVYDDPTGKRGRIIPLIVQKYEPETLEPLEIPFALRILRYLDFSDRRRFESTYQILLARLRGYARGQGRRLGLVDQIGVVNPSAGPDVASLVEEVVLGNLFPAELPGRLYSDFSTTSSYREIRDSFADGFRTPFVLHSARLYSFVPPDYPGNPFRRFLTGAGRREETCDDLFRNPERVRHLIWLCNDALRERCHELRLRAAPGHTDLFYPITAEGQKRTFTWGSGSPLTLAKVSDGENPLGVHHAASLRFIEIGGAIHLVIEPRYFFTTDGYNPVGGKKSGRYSVQWGNREGNRTVLRRMLMWPRIVSRGQMEVILRTGGPEPIKVATAPLHGRCTRGILGDAKDIQSLLEGEAAGEVEQDDELDAIAAEHVLAELGADDDQFSGDDSGEEDDVGAEEPLLLENDEQELPF